MTLRQFFRDVASKGRGWSSQRATFAVSSVSVPSLAKKLTTSALLCLAILAPQNLHVSLSCSLTLDLNQLMSQLNSIDAFCGILLDSDSF